MKAAAAARRKAAREPPPASDPPRPASISRQRPPTHARVCLCPRSPTPARVDAHAHLRLRLRPRQCQPHEFLFSGLLLHLLFLLLYHRRRRAAFSLGCHCTHHTIVTVYFSSRCTGMLHCCTNHVNIARVLFLAVVLRWSYAPWRSCRVTFHSMLYPLEGSLPEVPAEPVIVEAHSLIVLFRQWLVEGLAVQVYLSKMGSQGKMRAEGKGTGTTLASTC
ncbi:hypothetical protein Taro_028984 [Colocasia esculenta]|uniref:Uncharacterized protein n=1 Tax=Colocasia esculenta TaxID=4460 RepID=A0A843VCP6_COLES|nr:hypothetical protein [Colocasia esculenta]